MGKPFRHYVVLMRHDTGHARIHVTAQSPEDAARMACQAERAPSRSVVYVRLDN